MTSIVPNAIIFDGRPGKVSMMTRPLKARVSLTGSHSYGHLTYKHMQTNELPEHLAEILR